MDNDFYKMSDLLAMALCLAYNSCCGHEISTTVSYHTHALFQIVCAPFDMKGCYKTGDTINLVPLRYLVLAQF